MTKLINTLRESRDLYSEKLRQLLLNYQKYPQALFCVYEGEDAKYYGVRIDALTAIEDRRQIPCRGKSDVLKLYDRVVSDINLSKSNTIFFIDRDFDGTRGRMCGDNLYVTPCYSIENLYVQNNAIRKVLIEEYGVDNFEDGEELESLMALYMKLLDQFCKCLTTLNAWIILQREKESPSAKLNLNNQRLNKFVSISLDKVDQLYTKDDLSSLFPEAVEVGDVELSEKEKELYLTDRTYAYRGKYLVEFLRVFLELIKADRQSAIPVHFKQKRNTKLNLSRANILSELSQYAETPECLRRFLGGVRQLLQEESNQTMA